MLTKTYNLQLVTSLTEGMTQLSQENFKTSKKLLSSSRPAALTGIPEKAEEDSETTVRQFIQVHLKLLEDMIKTTTFYRTHCLGGKQLDQGRAQLCPNLDILNRKSW